MRFRHLIRTLLLVILALPAARAADEASITTIMQMADYMGVDYPEFVQDGQVLNRAEYREQLEFAAAIRRQLAELPAGAGKQGLLNLAEQLEQAVQAKAEGERITSLTAELNRQLLAHYPITVAPRQAPDLARGAELFQQNCIACHGAEGRGDGPAAAGMEPPPTDFHDRARQGQRSPFSLYNTLTLGVEEAGMPSFSQLSDAERWALAFYVSQLQFTPAERRAGAELWQEQAAGAQRLDSLSALSQLTPNELQRSAGDEAVAMLAYLRSQPQILAPSGNQGLQFAADTLQRSLEAYRGGEPREAAQLALTAYLEGFELAEPSLSAVDAPLMRQTEAAMMDFRQLIQRRADEGAVAAQAERIQELLAQAQQTIGGERLSGAASFTGSFLILAREGLEAILVLAAVFAVVRKSGRREALPYVHGGWMLAVGLGFATWAASSYLIHISGASRELTEGATALIAAVMLLYVGFWLHSKSYASRWQQFLNDKIGGALAKRSLWALGLVAFLAVYREMFETVLFYRALWAQGNSAAILGGMAAAAALLAAVSAAIFYFSLRLPVKQFFSWSSIAIALLAVIFVGHGVAALQEAGVLPVDPLHIAAIPVLGIYRNLESVLAQLVMLLLVLAAFGYNHLSARRLESRPA